MQSMYELKNHQGPLVVAELSGNHDGSLERAVELMDLAQSSGADAVKIQTYTEDSLTLDSDREEFKIKGGLWGGQTLYELYKKARTPREWMKPLFKHAREKGILLFSSPFSPEDVDALEDAGCGAYKIASYELNYPELIELCAATHKPMVISTGLGNLKEVDLAVEIATRAGCSELTLLHCESRYPAEPRSFNLRTIPFYKKRYGCFAGLSDHALINTADIAAAALGADMIEKHFTDDRKKGGVDSAFSMEPDDLKALRRDTEIAYCALGVEDQILHDDELALRKGRRSVYLVRNLKKGEILKRSDVKIVRPGCGLSPYELPLLIGKKACCDLLAPCPLESKYFE